MKKTNTKSKAQPRTAGSLERVVSRLHRVTFYINPNDPDGQRIVVPGLMDDQGLTIAAGHFGCEKQSITTRNRMVTEKYLKALPEYDG